MAWITTASPRPSSSTTGADIFNTFDFKTGWAQHAFTLGTEYYHDAGEGRVNGSIEPQNRRPARMWSVSTPSIA